jgi:LCP family protein required for cell wall assembly
MLIRADPKTQTISLLSIPRDLQVPVWCPRRAQSLGTTRIDYAFAYCGPAGSLETVRKLTGLQINYLITVDFHGFKEIVNDLGGVWLDIDRSYYNKNVGTAATDYANIDLQPGYQKLSGGSALEFVRFRHTDSDLYRLAREQEFLRAIRDQVARSFDPLELPKIVSDIAHNVEVGSKNGFSDTTVLSWALFAATLPPGHIFQNYISDVAGVNVGGAQELTASSYTISNAIARFLNPNLGASKAAGDAALRVRVAIRSTAAPPPSRTTVTVLNGNGVAGAAAVASSLLAARGYRTVLPADGAAANAPSYTYLHSRVYYDPRRPGAQAAATRLAGLLAPAIVEPLPAVRSLLSLDPGAMVVAIVGQTFHGRLAAPRSAAPAQPQYVPPQTRYDPAVALALLRPLAAKVPFTLDSPAVLERSSQPDTYPGDADARLYWIDSHHRAVRLVFVTGAGEFWGIEETDLPSPPILEAPSFSRYVGGRRLQFYYAGKNLHMIVLRDGAASYWVVNTLLNSLSSETMIAIARGLQPVHPGR